MSLPAPRSRPFPVSRIGTLEAEICVSAARGPLSSPERLLASFRAELLPILSTVLDAAPFAQSDIKLPYLEIDLGTWPDDPPWSLVRQRFANDLRAALIPHLNSRRSENPGAPETRAVRAETPNRASVAASAQSAQAFLAGISLLSPADQLAALVIESARINDATDVRSVPGIPDQSNARDAQTPAGFSLPQRSGAPFSIGALLDALEAEPEQKASLIREFESLALKERANLRDVLMQMSAKSTAITSTLDQWIDALPTSDLKAALRVHTLFAPFVNASAAQQWGGVLALLSRDKTRSRTGDHAIPGTAKKTGRGKENIDGLEVLLSSAARRSITRLVPPLQDAIRDLRALTAARIRPGDLGYQPDTPDAALRRISGLPAAAQGPALLAHVAMYPAHLVALKSSATAHLRTLCDPLVQRALEEPSQKSLRTQAAVDLHSLVEQHNTSPPERSADWVEIARRLAPDLVFILMGHSSPAREMENAHDAPETGARSGAGSVVKSTPDTQQNTPTDGTLGQTDALFQPGIARFEAAETEMRLALSRLPESRANAARIAARVTAIWALICAGEQRNEPPTGSGRDASRTADPQPARATADQRDIRAAFDLAEDDHLTHALSVLSQRDPEHFLACLNGLSNPDIGRAMQLAGAWPTLLRAPDLKDAKLRALWRDHAHAIEAALQSLDKAELIVLASGLITQSSTELHFKLDEFAQDPETSVGAMRGLVATLLNAEPIDFESLGARATPLTALLNLIELDPETRTGLDRGEPASLGRNLDILLDVAVSPQLRAVLNQIWAAWPTGGKSIIAPPAQSNRGSEPQPMSENHWPIWPAILPEILHDPGTLTAEAIVERVLTRLEPDTDMRTSALRVVSARLALVNPADPQSGRDAQSAAQRILAAILTPESLPNQPAKPATKDTLWATQAAGLSLLKPYLELLFSRMEIEAFEKRLRPQDLPRALATLDALVETGAGVDPLKKVLLGLEPESPPIEPFELDSDALEMVEGLLRALIAQWGRLGATVPDGLRDTFLNRTGAFEIKDDGVYLRVAPGPFDMLMDALPWSVTPIKLPWMPRPLHVKWRDADD